MDHAAITASAELRRPPGLAHSLAVLAGAVVILGVGFGVLKAKPEAPLVAAAALAGLAAWALGLGWKEIQSGIMQSIMKGLPAILIVVVVGALIGSWLAAGIIPMAIYYGVGLITPRFFLLTACVAAALVSMLTGTGYGTIGTVGVAFMGIAHGLGVPAGEAAGALVSGAYLGDKISPLAANANLAVAVAEVNIYDHIRHCLWTTAPALALAFAVYSLAGHSGVHPLAAGDGAAGLRGTLAGHFVFSPWLLLPPLITITMMAFRRPVIPGMLLSVGAALVLAVTVQHASPSDALNAMVGGYAPNTGVKAIDQLLAQGGMLSMMHVTLVALCAFAFSGILQKAGLLDPVVNRLLGFARNRGRLVLSTGLGCVAVGLLTGSAFLCILIPGEIFAPAYRRMDLPAQNLSRAVADWGIAGVPLIPWSIAGAFMSGTLGVPVAAYAPWAVFCYAGAVFSLVAAYAPGRPRRDAPRPAGP